ncbi:GrdX protein, partial [Clostridiaceae bacterium UIB06]|nr:GrdX protein [Clostridiaceae bacterium UIB06]
MIEPIIIVTNNPMSRENLKSSHIVHFLDGNTIEVLKKVRDY